MSAFIAALIWNTASAIFFTLIFIIAATQRSLIPRFYEESLSGVIYTVGQPDRPAFHVTELVGGRTWWNVGLAVLGTLTGLMSYFSLRLCEEYFQVSRMSRGYSSRKRRKNELQSWLAANLRGSFLITTTSMSLISTILLFGCHDGDFQIGGGFTSHSTQALETQNVTFNGVRLGIDEVDLEPYFSKSAAVHAAQVSGPGATNPETLQPWDTVDSKVDRVGETVYGDFGWFPGVGISTSALYGFINGDDQLKAPRGVPLRAPYPSSSTFKGLEATVYGTAIEVACADITEKYEVNRDPVRDMYHAQIPDIPTQTSDGRELGLVQFSWVWPSMLTKGISVKEHQMDLYSALIKPNGSEWDLPELRQIVVVGEVDFFIRTGLPTTVTVAECTYTGHDRVVSVRAERSRPNAVSVAEVPDRPGTPLTARDMYSAAEMIQHLLEYHSGGAMMRALKKWEVGPSKRKKELPSLLSAVFAETAGIYFTLKRQRSEVWSLFETEHKLYGGDGLPSTLVENVVTVTGPMIGRGHPGWMLVPGVLGCLAVLALVRLVVSAATGTGDGGYVLKPLPPVPDEDGSVSGVVISPYEDEPMTPSEGESFSDDGR
jgi:hypothetical protein